MDNTDNDTDSDFAVSKAWPHTQLQLAKDFGGGGGKIRILGQNLGRSQVLQYVCIKPCWATSITLLLCPPVDLG
jgi:hypothetical protein